MTEPNNNTDQSIFKWQLPLADLCRQLDRIQTSKSILRRFVERSIVSENDLEVNEYDLNCSICQETYYSERPVKLPCGHIFGHRCATRWLQTAKTCPTCRAKLVRPDRKLSYNRSILHIDRLWIFRRFLLFLIQRYG